MLIEKNIIGLSYSENATKFMHAADAATGEKLPGRFHVASDEDIDQAVSKAYHAFLVYRSISGKQKASFLEAITEEIELLGEKLIERAVAETGLTKDRLRNERDRTINQLRLFSSLLREGSWVEATVDLPTPDRIPMLKYDLRKMLLPVGPTIVFAASNFPLAFSTAGGDAASSLAAGCPVIVKAHSSHLGTNALVAYAVQQAATRTNMPDGVFSSLNGNGLEVGQKLVRHPLVKAVAFTGSFNGGKALVEIAMMRPEPIPVFAEMGSINPVILLPDKLHKDAHDVASMYAASITLGVGQFCTNPGLILAIESETLTSFATLLGAKISNQKAGVMLNQFISRSYNTRLNTVLQQRGVQLVGRGEENGFAGVPTVVEVGGSDFLQNPCLHEEVFGPFSMIVRCSSIHELKYILNELKGQLTATLMASETDLKQYGDVVNVVREKAGRIIFNSVPTGVEVCYAMQHGGPYPATTDSRFTSVGADAIKRFARPVCFQNAPQEFLPDELKDDNPLNIWRRINGLLSKTKASL